MFFCSTCKRVLGDARRKPSRKTCSNCLKRSVERARMRRARYKVETRDRDSMRMQCNMRFCSSCKGHKGVENFFGKNKSCKICLFRRRQTRNIHKASTDFIHLFSDELQLPLPENTEEFKQLTASTHCALDT